jgi:hypothetical protein
VRLQLHALAYNLANFLRTAATPELIERWSLTSLRERLIKTGTRLVRHARYAVFQMAEAALPRPVFAGILGLINGLRRAASRDGASMNGAAVRPSAFFAGGGRGVTGSRQNQALSCVRRSGVSIAASAATIRHAARGANWLDRPATRGHR